MKLRRSRRQRATAAMTSMLVGAMVLTACDWTRVTELESEGWRVLDDGNGTVTLEVSSRRDEFNTVGSDEAVVSMMNRGGAVRFQVGDGRADYLQEDLAVSSVSEIEGLLYLVGIREDSGSGVLPTIEIDVVDGDSTRTLLLDAPGALADTDGPPLVSALAEGDRTEWATIVVDAWEPVWRFVDDGPDAGAVALSDLPEGTTIADGPDEGLHIVVDDYAAPGDVTGENDVSADGFDGYVDGLFVGRSDSDGNEDPFGEGQAWDFEVPTTHVRVTPRALNGWVTSGAGASFVDGPTASPEIGDQLPDQDQDSVRLDGTEQVVFVGTDRYDSTQLASIGTLRYRTYMNDTCAMPALSIGVEYTPEIEVFEGEVAPERTVLLGHPCSTVGPLRTEASAEPVDGSGFWVDVDAATFTYLDPSTGGWTTIDEFVAAHPDARITSIENDGESMPEGAPSTLPGIALHGGVAIWQLLQGGLVSTLEDAPAAPSVYASDFTLGHVGDTSTTTFDFGPAPVGGGGGGVPGYTITVPAGGGTGSTPLPGGTGSITTGGNADGGTFSLFPGGDPAGTPGNFDVLGQSWNILPPAGFDFDDAEVCLPYDEGALTAAGYDEDDLALVHYAADGTLEDITTSIDTVDHIICGETTSFSPFAIGILDVDRLAGVDRAATAAAISAATFDPGAPVAYIATGGGFADALAGGPAAAAGDGPVLLVDDDIPAVTATELARLRPGRIVVLGGTSAVADGILDELRALTDGTVSRLAGADRYETAAQVSQAVFAPGADVVYVATGQQYADALTGGAAAARDGAPVLLVEPSAIPAAIGSELARLDPAGIVVLGGTTAVDESVVDGLELIAPVSRLGGADRYETAAAIAATFSTPAESLFVATGRAFPDALTGVPAAGASQSPILLVDGSVPASTDAQVKRLDPASMRILGGTAAIADAVVHVLRDAMLN